MRSGFFTVLSLTTLTSTGVQPACCNRRLGGSASHLHARLGIDVYEKEHVLVERLLHLLRILVRDGLRQCRVGVCRQRTQEIESLYKSLGVGGQRLTLDIDDRRRIGREGVRGSDEKNERGG